MRSIGETYTGTDVTSGLTYTGTISEVRVIPDLFGRTHDHCEVVYQLHVPDLYYANSNPIRPLVR